MNCAETITERGVEAPAECVIQMPLGLLGFERCKRFALVTLPQEEPFLWLRSLDDAQLVFLVMSPFVALPDYRPELAEQDVQFLGLKDPADTLVFTIVTVNGPQRATVNLKGPIVLNRQTLVAKQVIPVNAQDYSVTQALPVGEE